MPVCALCEREVPSLRKSHILPEPFYKLAYGPTHSYPIISSLTQEPISKPEQCGLKERLLGQCCENKLSKWETYALGLMWHRMRHPGEDKGSHFEFRVDYAKFKLFLLSILWRMAVSELQVFEAVDLGQKHLSRLKRMLQESDPGPEYEYVCRLAAIAAPDEPLARPIISPRRFRTRMGHTSYDLIARGILWQFLVSSHTAIIPKHEIPLTEDGVLRVYKRGTIPEERYMCGGVRDVLKKYEPVVLGDAPAQDEQGFPVFEGPSTRLKRS